jgi:hypothetical protein
MGLTEDPSKRSYLFIDESGDVAGSPDDAFRRYLCLCGCIIHHANHEARVKPEFERLKLDHLPRHKKVPVFLHRRDICQRRGPFEVLKDRGRCAAFNEALLELFRSLPYRVVVIVIDKEAETLKRSRNFSDPYHYAFALMLERFVGYLRFHRRVGNVVLEARGPDEDRKIEAAHRNIYERGTAYHTPTFFQTRLRSAAPAFRDKKKLVAGLELADLLASPAKFDVLADNGICVRRPGSFRDKVEHCLAAKYNSRFLTGRVKGYGKVFHTWPPSDVA